MRPHALRTRGGGKRCGFTLLELLVAVFISAVLFALGYAALNQVIARRADLQSEQQALDALRRTWTLLALDIAQVEPRPVRDPSGSALEAALQVDSRDGRLISLTRSGERKALGADRPALQRIEWQLEGNQLWRVSALTVDGTLGAPARRRALLEGIRSVSIRCRDADGTWHTSWPVAGGTAAQTPTPSLRSRPVAIEVTLETDRFGVMTRLIEVPG